MKNFIFTFAVIVIFFVLITYIFHKIFKDRGLVKYIPSIAALAFGVYSIYLAKTSNQSFQDIGYMLLGIMSLTGFLSGIITGIFFDCVFPRIRHR